MAPTQDEVLGYFTSLSNWGRWGDDDQRGTLNHITDEVRLAAARAVRHGRSVSCAWELKAPDDMDRSTTTVPRAVDMPGAGHMPPLFHNDNRWGFTNERLAFTYHGNTLTHLDAPSHLSWDGRLYNNRPATSTNTDTGAAWSAVTEAGQGITTRGVLLDVAAVRKVPWLQPGDPVHPTDLEQAEQAQGVKVRPGDAVLLRTGNGRARRETKVDSSGITQSGWHASCLPWLQERGVALIGADTPQDVQPSGYENILMPVHAVALVAMGLWLLDNCDLEACATTAAELTQWDFHLTIAPLRLSGTSGSPVNPVAIF
ncbi:cyclase family protein [Actinoplanes sp. NPDC000266]